ncbi:reprolysin-like metallopeptidase [Streptomyces sp. NPDC051563]|uniref:InlB B-repeat-containing protein n=1 Tax=Streptomyces sp. NPDC051563 TaxID=3365659 RepID=UPI0037BD3D40
MNSIRRIRRTSLAVLCTAALLPLTGTATAQPGPSTPADTRAGVLRERVTDLDPGDYQWLCTSAAGGAGLAAGPALEHTFDLFDDVRLVMVEDRLDRDGASLTWSGRLKDDANTRIRLSAHGLCDGDADPKADAVEAHINHGNRIYRLSMVAGAPGKVRVTEEDPALYPKPVVEKNAPMAQPVSAELLRAAQRKLEARGRSFAVPVTIDVIIGYTPAARDRVGGEAAINERIRLSVAMLNEAFATSKVAASVELIGTYDTGYRGKQTAALMRPKMADPLDADLGRKANQLREDFGVDLVSVINSAPGESSGQGSLPEPFIRPGSDKDAFSVVDVDSLVQWYNLGHEIGHNLGLWHDRETLRQQGYPVDDTTSSTPYGFGFITRNQNYADLMAYKTSCKVYCENLNQYSGPDGRTPDGQPMGDANNNAAATARLTAPIVAGYRTLNARKSEVLRHTLTLSATEGGTVRAASFGPYKPGTRVTVIAEATPGFRLAQWIVAGQTYNAGGGDRISFTIGANTDIKAVFTRV